MLKGLLQRKEKGLIMERKPEERLVVSCRFHSMLLASILKYQEVPARVRVGFANYLDKKNNKRHKQRTSSK